MAPSYSEAVRHGAAAAARVHRDHSTRATHERSGGCVNVFAIIHELNIPLLLRPLEGLLGAYLSVPSPGILVTTMRPMSIQRFTAAHELGHCVMNHQPSLDDEDSILRRMPLAERGGNRLQETEADSFAVNLMMPKWLIAIHMRRQSWSAPKDLRNPHILYQLSLRMGSSYEAFCWTLVRYGMLSTSEAKKILTTKPKMIKEDLLRDYKPENYRGDVWFLTEKDAGSQINGSKNDLFILKLHEHSNGGYLWNVDELHDSGFAVVENRVEERHGESVGAVGVRRVTAQSKAFCGRLELTEVRPWDHQQALTSFSMEMDFTGPEEVGLSRAERRRMLEAA